VTLRQFAAVPESSLNSVTCLDLIVKEGLVNTRAEMDGAGQRKFHIACAALLALAIQAPAATLSPPTAPAMTEISNPAAAHSYYPMLTGGAGNEILLSWQEPLEGMRCRLRFAAWRSGAWQGPSTVSEGYFAPYATMIPGVIRLDTGALFAYWTNWDRKWVYTSTSPDGGARWTEPEVVHKDRSGEDHGFISAVADGDAASIVWLDGGEYPKRQQFHLEETHVSASGRAMAEVTLDSDVCTCCPTASVRTADGLLVAYRDHTGGVRDISLVRLAHGKWSEPYPLHRDGWEIDGCPSNSVSLGAKGQQVAAAWFTGAKGQPRVSVAFSDDSGKTFTDPVQVDSGNPFGYPSVVMPDGGGALVSWLEKDGGNYQVRIVRVQPGAGKSKRLIVAGGAKKEVNYPHLVSSGSSVMVAWGSANGIRTALIQ